MVHSPQLFTAKITIFLVLVLGCTSLKSQSVSIAITPFYGLAFPQKGDPAKNGLALESAYRFQAGKGAVTAGLEYRSILWGSQVGINLGYRFKYWEKGNLKIIGQTRLQAGLALFRPSPLGTWAVEYSPSLEWRKPDKKMGLFIGLGLRYTSCPGYKEYSPFNQALDGYLCLGLFWGKTKPSNRVSTQ